MTGVVVKKMLQRRSPAGLPIARFVLDHRSRQFEAGLERDAQFRIVVMACGELLAAQATQLIPGTLVDVGGFISRSDNRSGEARLVLHADHIAPRPQT